jgi:drug/metabolite transporter (DMT)-like permease
MENEQPASDRKHAILALVLVNALWGASFPMMKYLNLQMDQHFGVTEFTASHWLRWASAAWMIGIRFALALVLFLIFFRRTLARIRLPHLLSGAVIGGCFFFGLLLQVIGLATIPASRSGFLTSLAVVITPILSTLLRRRFPRKVVLLGAAVALLGVAILTELIQIDRGGIGFANDAWSRWTLGDSLTVLSAMFFSLQILTVDHFGRRYESLAFTPSMFGVTAILAFTAFAVLSPQVPEVSVAQIGWLELARQPRFFVLIILLCIFPSLLAFACMNKYQPAVTAVQAAVIYTLEPLFASLWAMFLPAMLSVLAAVAYANETLTLPLFIGGGLVLVANILALWPEPSPQ